MNDPLAALRQEYDRHAGRSIALPIAGAIVWTVVAIAGAVLEPRLATFVLLFGTGLAFPVALALARPLGERLIDNPSPLAGLMGRSVVMVNLLWAVHLTLAVQDWAYLPLTLGIGLGLHWVVFGWVIGHPVGLVHAALRTVLVTAAWWVFPDARVSAVAAAVVLTYGYALAVLASRQRPG
ncbi:MAG: hypothetical protein EA416_04280 [Trueperaceae bacterium]|nr:MAG: hypothetical protein EA416_04280 [Trueperaceae bacterium]